MTTHRTAHTLSPVEHLVLQGLANGHSNPEIANHMCRAVSTIKTHVADVLAKLGARNRAHAVRLAINAGLLTTDHIKAVRAEARP